MFQSGELSGLTIGFLVSVDTKLVSWATKTVYIFEKLMELHGGKKKLKRKNKFASKNKWEKTIIENMDKYSEKKYIYI